MIIPSLNGGLGNMMFQLASNYSFAKQTGHTFGICDSFISGHHSTIDYSENILKPWVQFKTVSTSDEVIIYQPYGDSPSNVSAIFDNCSTSSTIKTIGYWQTYEYIEPHKDEILPLFELNKNVVMSYSDITDAYFLHVRRGDYVGHFFHELDLSQYYKKAVDHIGSGVAYIVSNDIPWCENWSFLTDIRHRIITENEVDTLSIMANCEKGGIAANSSFSWWGLYMNSNRPNLIIPNTWHNSQHYSGYQYNYKFPGTTVLDI